jgi:hypothetical protein
MVSLGNILMLAVTLALAVVVATSAPSQSGGMTVIATVVPA